MSIENTIIPLVFGLITFFLGRYIKILDKSIETVKKENSESKVKDAVQDEKLYNLKVRNQEVSIKMKEEISNLAGSMDKIASSVSELFKVTSLHNLKIENLRSGQEIITGELRDIKNFRKSK